MNQSLLTKEEKDQLRPIRVNESRQYHKDLIERLGINQSDFNIKAPWTNKSGKEFVLLFESEFLRDKGFYFELIDSNLNFYQSRQVYKVSTNTSFKDEFETWGNDPDKLKYLVPIEEIRPVDVQSVVISKASAVLSSEEILNQNKQKTFSSFSNNAVPLQDAPYSEMTLKDHFAITHKQPVSDKKWLNDLIKSLK